MASLRFFRTAFFNMALLAAMITPVPAGQSQTQEPEVSEQAEGPTETVVVTAARSEQRLVDSSALVSVVSGTELEASPNLVLDDALRQVPGFSLFRRSSSLTSHPTTQGVSLRGIGPSGTSRSLVLFDGIPLNDPFGGWVYWNRIPTMALSRVEIVRGAGSPLYGSSALGGTIQLFSLQPRLQNFKAEGLGGNLHTWNLSALAGDQVEDWNYLVSGRLFDTAGAYLVDESVRGEVDVPADTAFQTFFGRVGYKDFRATINIYAEDRGNGTPLQRNSSELFSFSAGLHRPRWAVDFYTQSGVLKSEFSRILPDRSAEFPTASQRFESEAFGASASVELPAEVLLGTDWRFVTWDGNGQNLWGVFGQKLVEFGSRVDLQLGARLDLWENESTQTSVNPRAGLLVRASEHVTARGSIYRGFRAPTLNELYRPFRVGNIVTSANAGLGAESLVGVEGGVDLHPTERYLVRLNGFWNRLQDPISNVTVGQSENLILRQRQNVADSTVKGLELEGLFQVSDSWNWRAAYLYSNSDLSGTGLRMPQVPLHQVTTGLDYSGPIIFSLQVRASGDAFEDDLNELELGAYAVVDLFVGRPFGEAWMVYFSAENLLNADYAVGRTPVERLGDPRMLQVGLRWSLIR